MIYLYDTTQKPNVYAIRPYVGILLSSESLMTEYRCIFMRRIFSQCFVSCSIDDKA